MEESVCRRKGECVQSGLSSKIGNGSPVDFVESVSHFGVVKTSGVLFSSGDSGSWVNRAVYEPAKNFRELLRAIRVNIPCGISTGLFEA